MADNPDTVVFDARNVRPANITGGTICSKRNHIIPRGWVEFRIANAVPGNAAPNVGTLRHQPPQSARRPDALEDG